MIKDRPAVIADYILIQHESGPNEAIASFNQSVREFYDADVDVTGLASQGSQISQRIGSWIRGKGLDEKRIAATFMASNHNTDDSSLLLINVFFFSGMWKHAFERLPEKQVFYNDGVNAVETDFMKINCTTAGLKDLTIAGQDVQALELEYKDSPVTMTIFLPKERNGLQSILRSANLATGLKQAIKDTSRGNYVTLKSVALTLKLTQEGKRCPSCFPCLQSSHIRT